MGSYEYAVGRGSGICRISGTERFVGITGEWYSCHTRRDTLTSSCFVSFFAARLVGMSKVVCVIGQGSDVDVIRIC